MMKGASPAYV